METNKSSITAWAVAMARVAHVRFDKPPHVFDDSLALQLIDPEFQKMIDIFGPSDRVPDEVYRNRPYLAYRQRYQEECLFKAYQQGVRQFVILGAGIDAYAFRQQKELADLQIFEVDFPATQLAKRERINALAWSWPENLHFAPCDFETDNLEDVLRRADFDLQQPGYFAWMGVTVYLTPATVTETLATVRKLATQGSSIAFEYALPYEELSGGDKACRDFSLAQDVRKMEPYLAYYSTHGMMALLERLGYSYLEPLDHDKAASEIEAGRDDGMSIYHGFRLILAHL